MEKILKTSGAVITAVCILITAVAVGAALFAGAWHQLGVAALSGTMAIAMMADGKEAGRQ